MSPYFVISQKSGKIFFLSIYPYFKLKLDDDDDDEQDNEDNLV